MSSGGPTSASSTSVSPSSHPGPTTTRRRVDAADRLSAFSDYYDVVSDEEDTLNGSSAGPHHHHHHHHPLIRYLLLRRKLFFFLPEAWLLAFEDGCYWIATMVQSLRSGKNMGRKIFAALTLMLVISVFLKVSFLDHHVEKSRENGLLILQTIKEDWAMAQRVVSENSASMPKRVLEKFPVSLNVPYTLISFSFSFPSHNHCLVPEKNLYYS